MERRIHYLTIGCGLAVIIAGAMALYTSPVRQASATTFARPQFERARPDTSLDLTKFATLARHGDLRKLAREPQACHDALDVSGVRYTPIKAINTGKGCGVEDAVTLDKSLIYARYGEDLQMTCGLAARLYLWETQVVAPAAEEHFGVPLARIEALGAYSCRNIAGEDKRSEHAFGKAADIGGFKLADGRVITVLNDFRDKGAKGAFLREIHDKACDLFDVTLGPDYNADHANHFHLDVGIDHACH